MKSSYRPTALERAYSTHLLLTYFATPVDASCNDEAEIRVAGRDAVPFLTTVSLVLLSMHHIECDGCQFYKYETPAVSVTADSFHCTIAVRSRT